MAGNFEKDLLRGSLDLMVLGILLDEPKYGYLIQKRIRLATDEQVKMQAGTLYPLLHRLESKKFIKSRWDDSTGRRRKWYELTTKGKKQLEVQKEQWQRYAGFICSLLDVQPT